MLQYALFVPLGGNVMILNATVLSVPTDSPWFFVGCGALLIAAVALIVYCLVRRPKFRDTVAETPSDLVGKTGLVTEEVDADAGTGLVTICGEGWAARPVYIDDVYPVGEIVTVLAVEGVKVVVKALE